MITLTMKPSVVRVAAWTTLVLLVGVVVSVIIYLATHGRVSIAAPTGTTISSVQYCSGNCTSQIESSDTTSVLLSGDYIVQVNLSNNTSYVANVHVGNFLKNSDITAKSRKYSPSPVATSTNQYIMPISNAFLTYDPDGSAYTTGQSVNIQVGKLTAAQYVNQNDLLLLEYKDLLQTDTTQPQRVLKYTKTSGALVELGTVSGVNASTIFHGNNALYATRSNTDGYTLFALSTAGIVETKIPTSITFGKNDTSPIMTASANRFAFVSGNDYVPHDSGEAAAPQIHDGLLSIYDATFTQLREIKLGARNDISSISFSPDSKLIAVVGNNSIVTYSVETGDKIFETRSQNTGVKSILWKSNDTFIYQLGTTGIYLCDMKNKEAYSIVDNSLLRITDISAVLDNKVYLTAYPNKTGNYEHTNTDGYVINLNDDISNSQPVSDVSIVRSLPYDGMTYSIGYHFDKNAHIVLDVTAGTGARNSAIQKISELGFDPGDYIIQFRDYSNPFGDQTGGSQ